MQYDYDVTGAVTKVRENGATSGLGLLATYAYDDRGRRTSITRGNGVATTFRYDAISRLDSLTQDLAGTADDQTLTFSHNPAQQLASRTATNAGYAWAGHVNVNETTIVNGLNQVATEAGVSFYYDARGNLTSDGETSYWYDADNRLTGATGGASLTYDALGRLYEASGNGMAATRFLYDGSALIAEYDTSGNLQRRFVHGPRSDEPLVWYEGATTSDRRWLIADERGSVIAVTDDTGNPLAINTYDEYGQPGSGNIGRFQFTGQAWIEAVELYYYKARFYAPAQGRFLQTDPIGYGDGLNLYGYAGGDPVNRIDPSGTEDIDERQIADEPIDEIIVYGSRRDWGWHSIDFFYGVGHIRAVGGGSVFGAQGSGESGYGLSAPSTASLAENSVAPSCGDKALGPNHVWGNPQSAAIDLAIYVGANPVQASNASGLAEQGGDIIPTDGPQGYYYNNVESQGDAYRVEFGFLRTAVGHFHLHPQSGFSQVDRQNRYLSPADWTTLRTLNKQFSQAIRGYLAGADGAIREFELGGSKKGVELRPAGCVPTS